MREEKGRIAQNKHTLGQMPVIECFKLPPPPPPSGCNAVPQYSDFKTGRPPGLLTTACCVVGVDVYGDVWMLLPDGVH